ncbi:MAG: AmmeMemoRadiSam system radical SAM enzyme [Phycisphaerae bacterium]
MSDLRDAMLSEKLDGDKVRCNLCGHQCVIAGGKYGVCRVRQNVGGTLKTLNYQSVVALNVDPIEKKPLFHFLPGTRALSIACAGCNFQCPFCQNWQISQSPRTGQVDAGQAVSPEQIVTAAERYECASVSYTYTEPTAFFELAYDTAKLARERGILNTFVSNGYMTPLAVETIAPYLDGINVDLKAFSDETYRKVMKASLEPVLTCLRELVRHNVWLEVTTLVVPGMNDSEQELRDIANFIAGELGADVPWHVSRFHGAYEWDGIPTTPMETLNTAVRLGKEAGLHHVYCGNVSGLADENTYCPDCETAVIERSGFSVRSIKLAEGKCPDCGREIAGVWSAKR